MKSLYVIHEKTQYSAKLLEIINNKSRVSSEFLFGIRLKETS